MLDRRQYVATFLLIFLIGYVTNDCLFPKGQSPRRGDSTWAPENYKISFRCPPGYKIKGSETIFCIYNKWTDKVPKCLKMKCPNPPEVPNAKYVLHSDANSPLTVGTTATYTCDRGYETTDSNLTCTLNPDINDLEWKGATPKCIEKEKCPDPGVSPDGTKSGNCCFTGDILEFSCNDDFELVGNNRTECLPGGKWNFPRPLCKPHGDHCDFPPNIPHGMTRDHKKGDYYLPDEEVEVLCHPGYYYNGSTEYIMCEEESGWEEEFEECVESFCDPPEPLVNGTIPEMKSSNMTVYPYNFELTYICDKGFRLIGDSWRFCDSRGWSGKSPICEAISCPDPGIPEYGTRIGNSFQIGDKVTFRCYTGYELLGSFQRYCMPNGEWSGELARCDHSHNYCPDPGIPVNGMKNSINYDLGEKVRFSCYGGFTLVGSEVRECLHSREWSGEEAKCVGPYDFDNSAKVGDTLKEAVAEKEAEQKRELEEYHKTQFQTLHKDLEPMRFGRMIDINHPGRLVFYFTFDVSGSIRKVNFNRSIEFAKAIVKKIGISKNGARAGALTFGSNAEIQFYPFQHETTAEVLAALDKINFTGGGTAASSALTLIREVIPLVQELLSKRGMKSIVFILTDGKANMGGDPKEQAKLLDELGVEIYCIGITNSFRKDALYKIASDPKEEHVFILQNYATLSYLVQEITNGTIDYSKCGLGREKFGKKVRRGKITGGHQASEPWPWMAALYFIQSPTESDLQCGGSIIHESFILTAAHCMYRKNSVRRNEREIIVKLGLTDVKNQSALQEFEVEKIIVHPSYSPGRLAYDYDIALLQLKRPIEFSAVIRPICLPPRNLPPGTSFYKAGENAVATGWGHSVQQPKEREYHMVEQLKELILPIRSRESCRKNVLDRHLKAKAFSERMFCAGYETGGIDACKGDSGGPLMQSLLNEDGYVYWTQVGIISWGFGCGEERNYGFYTHVQNLVDWVMSKIPSKN